MKNSPHLAARLLKFPGKTRREKISSYVYRWFKWFPGVPALLRLPMGAWWLTDNDFIGACLIEDGYEESERNFFARFIKPGMVVLDIGAHRGYHTLLFSRLVAAIGLVISVEPSPVDRRRLKLHLALNFCRNVTVVPCALGNENGDAEMHIAGANTVLNSLRPRDPQIPTHTTKVSIRKLDDVLSEYGNKSVDFVKLDVEGGEIDVLRGAERLLGSLPRPVILCEVLDETTRLWGYSSQSIIAHLRDRGFTWFALNGTGKLAIADGNTDSLQGNFVAIPAERLSILDTLFEARQDIANETSR